MNALLIVNPAAGQGRPQAALGELQAALGPLLGEITLTQKAGDAEEAARGAAAAGFDAVLVAGGDGTVNEAINGLLSAPKTLPLGLIPLGTQNVLAHELGFDADDDLFTLEARLWAGKTRRLDVGRLMCGTQSRYFVLMAGFGFDAVVVRDVLHFVKERIGPAAYALSTLGTLAKYRSTAITLTLDGEEIHSEAFLVVIANAASYGDRLIKLAPFAAPDDGWLDVCVFERPRVGRVGFATQVVAVLARRHLRDPSVRYYRAKTITLSSEPPISGHLDGEMFSATPITITIVPQALTVFVP